MVELLAQQTSTFPDLSGLMVYGPLGAMFIGFMLLARKYVPRLFDAMLENIESGKKQSIRAADSTERIEETMKAQTEHLATISESTAATAECIQDLGAIHKQQADQQRQQTEAMQAMLKSLNAISCVNHGK